jgi:hypothetical protein
VSKLVKRQLAEIRRQTGREELAKMRAHIKAKKKRLAELQADERNWTSERKAERKRRLHGLRDAIRKALAQQKGLRTVRLRQIHEKRKAFQVWWADVRKERAQRLAEIQKMRNELRDWSKDLPRRRAESTEQISAEAMRQLAKFDKETAESLDAMTKAIASARRELKSDEYDLKVWTGNRRKERATAVKPLRRSRAEASEERTSEVEANLESGEELAWWHKNRGQILRRAKELGVSAPDGIAELVREAVEADPDRALEYLQEDADAWVAAELRKQGFAA